MGLHLAELSTQSCLCFVDRRSGLLSRRSLYIAAAEGTAEACQQELAGDSRPGLPQDRVSFVRALGRIARLGCWISGRTLHGLVVTSGRSCDRFIAASLIDMYVKCGDLDSAGELFDRLDDPDVVAWNSLAAGYAANGLPERALDLFLRLMAAGDLPPSGHSISIAAGACGDMQAAEEGKQLHAVAVKSSFLVQDTAVGNSLVTMYGKCGMIREAEAMFEEMPQRNSVSWNAMANVFFKNGSSERALEQLSRMRTSDDVAMDCHAWALSLACCGKLRRLRWGKAVHGQVTKCGHSSDAFVSSAVVDMYSACAEMVDAEKKLEEDAPSVGSWNALLSGYVRHGMFEDALEAFRRMSQRAPSVDQFTFSAVLKACSSLPSLAGGEQIHGQLVKSGAGHVANLHLGSSLIEMYSRCGCLPEAERVFNAMEEKDTVAWNSMLRGYAQCAPGEKAIVLYNRMRKEGVPPSGPTFLAVLSACSHSGLVRQGRQIFDSMASDLGVEPEELHYACMVDLLSRRGLLREAADFIAGLPAELSSSLSSVWRPLLAAARSRGDLGTAEQVAGRMLEMNPDDHTVYVTLANMYAGGGREDEAANQWRRMSEKALRKEPGCSWIEVGNRVHTFFFLCGWNPHSLYLEQISPRPAGP